MATRRATHPVSLNLSVRRVGLVALATLIVFGSGLAVGLRTGNGDEQGGEAAAPSTTARYPDPGPTRVVEGVGLGYARSESGALAAATEFVGVSGGSTVTDRAAYRAALETMAAPEWRARTRETGANATDFALDRYGAGATVVTTPVAHRIASFSPEAASVELWAVMTAAGPKLEDAEQNWITARLQLRWVEDDWRLSSEDTTSGPTPALLAGDSNGGAAGLLEDFELND
ncbi:MAG: hypothetical protein ACREJS_08565 [Candidatus Rokuibacteriota bacterium]